MHSLDGRALLLVNPNFAEPFAFAREFLLDLRAEPKHLCVRASARVRADGCLVCAHARVRVCVWMRVGGCAIQ